jgi:hypothetical protein
MPMAILTDGQEWNFFLPPIERMGSLRSVLRFRVPLGDGAHKLEVLR